MNLNIRRLNKLSNFFFILIIVVILACFPSGLSSVQADGVKSSDEILCDKAWEAIEQFDYKEANEENIMKAAVGLHKQG